MNILSSEQVPTTFYIAITLYPLLFGTLGKLQWVKDILPPKAGVQKQYHLCNKIVASLHSTIMTVVGFYLLLSVDWSKNDIRTYKTDITAFLVGLEFGYLVQDTAFEFYQRIQFGIGSNLILFHHVSVILGAIYYLYDLFLELPGPYFIGLLSLMNMSTPILHYRWVLQTRGRTFTNSKLKRFTDTALLVTYFWCRLFGNWWMAVAIGAKIGVSWYQVPVTVEKKYTFTASIMFFMNAVWWLILAKQWLKSVTGFYFSKNAKKLE